MKNKIALGTFLLLSLFSCEFSKSTSKNLATGLTTTGNGISCDDVYLSNGEEKINRNSFTYGEEFTLNFSDITGFEKGNENVFPGLELLILDKKGDTIMFNSDLYAENDTGFDYFPLLLKSKVTVANPMHSNNEYDVFVNIWDKKGEGTFKADMSFEVKPNSNIKIEEKNISYDEVYLFSKERNVSIISNQAHLNENIFMIFEGLVGFKIEDGKASLGLSIKAIDADGNIILNENDLIGDSSIEASEINKQLAPNFIFSGSDIKNPINCEIQIWDKKSDHTIKASVQLNIN